MKNYLCIFVKNFRSTLVDSLAESIPMEDYKKKHGLHWILKLIFRQKLHFIQFFKAFSAPRNTYCRSNLFCLATFVHKILTRKLFIEFNTYACLELEIDFNRDTNHGNIFRVSILSYQPTRYSTDERRVQKSTYFLWRRQTKRLYTHWYGYV